MNSEIISLIQCFFLQSLAQGNTTRTTSRRPSEAVIKESSPEPEIESSGDEQDEEKKAARLERRVKAMRKKLNKIKEKQKASRKERENLKTAVKKNQELLKYKLQLIIFYSISINHHLDLSSNLGMRRRITRNYNVKLTKWQL